MHRWLITAALSLAAGHSAAQKWEFVTYNGNQPAGTGYVTLEESGGEATFRMVAPNLDPCWAKPLKAEVTRTDTLLIIVPRFVFQGCIEQRFQIRLDGKGGITEFRQKGEWVKSSRDRKLTLMP